MQETLTERFTRRSAEGLLEFSEHPSPEGIDGLTAFYWWEQVGALGVAMQ